MRILSQAALRGAWLAAVLFAAPPARAETELSFYTGWQGAAPGVLHSSMLGDMGVTWEGRPFAMPPYYGARVTWWRDGSSRLGGLGFGLEFNHAKVYASDPAALGFDRLELTNGHNLITVNLWTRLKPIGKVQPYAGFGLGVAIPHVDFQPTGEVHTFGYQVTGPAAQWVLGASLPLNDRWSLFGEYKGSFSSNHITLDSGGTIDTDIQTNALNLGVSLQF